MHVIPNCETCKSRKNCIFDGLSEASIRKIQASKGCNLYRKGQFIFYDGDVPMNLYCIYSGAAKIYRTAENGNGQIIRLTESGDIIGYRSLLEGRPYRAICETLKDSVVCIIPKETFLYLIRSDESFCQEFIMFLCGELERSQEQMLSLSRKSVRERTAEALIFLHDKLGLRSDDKTLNIELTRDNFANIVGTTRESITRNLHEFKHQRLIELDGRKIALLDIQKISKIARIY